MAYAAFLGAFYTKKNIQKKVDFKIVRYMSPLLSLKTGIE